MANRWTAGLLGMSVGSGLVAVANQCLIAKPQKEILSNLRIALMNPDIYDKQVIESNMNKKLPLFSRGTVNLVVIALSDRLVY